MLKLLEYEKIIEEDFDDDDDDIPVVDGFESESYERIREKMDIRHQYMLDKKDPKKQNVPSYEFARKRRSPIGAPPQIQLFFC